LCDQLAIFFVRSAQFVIFDERRASSDFLFVDAVTIGVLGAIWTQAIFFFDQGSHVLDVATVSCVVVRQCI
jgi:hypothetical protein